MYASRTRKKGTGNGHKESGEQDQADGHRVHRLPRGVHHHQRVEHLDGPDDGRGRAQEGLCAGRQRADTGPPDHDGGNARRGSQEPCRNVPPLSLYMFSIEIRGK